jgi:histidyl-tRNA synthetase
MKIEVGTVKGFADYLPPESLKRKKVREIVEKWFSLFGFLPVETPVVEFDELMRGDSLPSEGEDEAVSERFRLQDRGGRNLGLRYEFTFQLARLFKENPNIKLPFKRYQIGPVFRDEPIRTGRTRQFTQCDVDIIGDSSVRADAECLALVSEILKELKIKDFEIQVNNRKLLQSLIESVQINRVKEAMRMLDKLEKLGEDEVKAELKKIADTNQIVTLFKLLGKDLEFFKKNAFPGADELEALRLACSNYGIKIRVNPTMTRGFSYYTGNVFEFLTAKKTAVIGGGRYDKAVGKFSNREIPAVGISFSLEALSGLFKSEIDALKVDGIPGVLVLSLGQDKMAVKLAQALRKKGVSCVVDSRKPGKALEWANAYGVQWVVFVGDEEVESKKFKLKNMQSGAEVLVTENALVKKLGGK